MSKDRSTESPPLRYWVFAWEIDNPSGGMGDFIGWYESDAEAKEKLKYQEWTYNHTHEIIDITTGEFIRN